MKKTFCQRTAILVSACVILFLVIGLPLSGLSEPAHDALRDGDIIFQVSESPQSLAIKLATKSKYSHCGIIFKAPDGYYVTEAVQPVQTIPLEKWIERGTERHYVVKRLKNANEVLTPDVIAKMKKVARGFEGKQYDIYFEWSDDKMYCSELVWKIYKRAAGIEVGPLKKLKEFNLDNPLVKLELRKRYGKNIPYEQRAVSPVDILDSPLLETVTE